MKILVPDYYNEFKCIAGKCRHTCCRGWEICVDEEKTEQYLKDPFIRGKIEKDEDGNHCFKLLPDESCPFLNGEGLCELIIRYGEESLCQICRDHPRYRNYWSDCTEIGLGIVCEEAARIILSRDKPAEWVTLEENSVPDGNVKSDCGAEETDAVPAVGNMIQPDCAPNADYAAKELPEDEAWLIDYRERLLNSVRDRESGPLARFHEYLINRHIPDALYDDRLEARVRFIEASVREISDAWAATDGSLDALVEIVIRWSYDVEYDEDELERRLSAEKM